MTGRSIRWFLISWTDCGVLILSTGFPRITITKFGDLIRDSLHQGVKPWMHLLRIGQLKITGCVHLSQWLSPSYTISWNARQKELWSFQNGDRHIFGLLSYNNLINSQLLWQISDTCVEWKTWLFQVQGSWRFTDHTSQCFRDAQASTC